MPRHAANGPGNFELSALVYFGGRETGFAAQRRWGRSAFEFVIDDDPSAPLGLAVDAMRRGRPHAAYYLFNSTPCAYTWFHH
jgi:hypothetical protein